MHLLVEDGRKAGSEMEHKLRNIRNSLMHVRFPSLPPVWHEYKIYNNCKYRVGPGHRSKILIVMPAPQLSLPGYLENTIPKLSVSFPFMQKKPWRSA
jgi:hypothetical protein